MKDYHLVVKSRQTILLFSQRTKNKNGQNFDFDKGHFQRP